MKMHTFVMALCLAVPIALLVGVYGFGIRSTAIYWVAIALCPLIHFVMMRQHSARDKDAKAGKEKCH